MFVSKLRLSDFRNYENQELDFQPGINLIYGPNGQGKTNLVEAINLFAGLSSHRVAALQMLIREGKTQAIIGLELKFQEKQLQLELELNRQGSNRARLNRSNVSRAREILGFLNSVIFAPEDLDIVKRDPSNRRAFLDQLVIQLSPRMYGVYSDYERVLKQRNTLLKTAKAARGELSTLDAWDKSLIEFGSEIISERAKLVQKLVPGLKESYKAIAKTNNEANAFLRSSVLETSKAEDDDMEASVLQTTNRGEIEELFASRLAEVRAKEIERGLTLVGPHRDDLLLTLGSLPTKGYASHGESWSFALALKLASLELLKEQSKLGDPILILDDVFAELDADRREKLAELIVGNEQVLITAAVIEDVPVRLASQRIQVMTGRATNG